MSDVQNANAQMLTWEAGRGTTGLWKFLNISVQLMILPQET